MKRICIAVAAAALLTTPLWAATQTTKLKVPGMTCPTCPITIKKALQRVPGVSKIAVNYEQKEVEVTYEDKQTNAAAIVKATRDAGFPSQLVGSGK